MPNLINPRSGSFIPIVDPPSAISALNASGFQYTTIPSGTTFEDAISSNHSNIALGGLMIDEVTGQATIAYETSRGSLSGLALLNLASNVLSDKARGTSGPKIIATYSNFPGMIASAVAARNVILA